MKRVLINNQQMNGLSWYRIQGVFCYLEKEMPEIKFGYSDEKFTWREMLNWDIIHFNRANGKQALEAITNLKMLKKTIWLDFDDNVFELDEQHQHHGAYNDEVKSINKEVFKLADVITVTTQYLKDILSEYNKNVIVIPNSYNEEIFPFRDMTKVNRDPIVLWRGSNFHRHDLFEYKDQIYNSIKNNDKFVWAFFGDDPWYFRDKYTSKQIKYIPPRDGVIYFNELYNAKPLVIHVPLKFDNFNLAKSNIAMLEAVLAGTVVIAPDTPEWQHEGVIRYKDAEDYRNKLEGFIYSSNEYITKHYNLLVEQVKDKFLLSKNNELRKEIIKNL